MVICLLKTDGESSELMQLTGKREYIFGREYGDIALADDAVLVDMPLCLWGRTASFGFGI